MEPVEVPPPALPEERYPPARPPGARGLTAIDGAMVLIVILLIVQMWLLMAALESYLAGHREAALPSAILSGLIFLACLGLYVFVGYVDADVRRPGPPEA